MTHQKEFTKEGGATPLKEDESIMLQIPKGAFSQDTMVTWSLEEDEESPFPVLDIDARYKTTGDDVKTFDKYVKIVYHDVISAPDDLSCIKPDLEYMPHHHVPFPRQEDDGDKDRELQSVFHTFYRTDGRDLIVFTKHFSVFRLLCKKHGSDKTYSGFLSADIYQRQRIVAGVVKVDVQIFLDVLHPTEKEKKGDYTFHDTIDLMPPPDSQVIVPGSTIDCTVSYLDTDMWTWTKTTSKGLCTMLKFPFAVWNCSMALKHT